MPTLNELAAEIHKIAADHGFWEQERNMGEMLMLMTSELAEALEEHRSGRPNVYHAINVAPDTAMTSEVAAILAKLRDNAEVAALGGEAVADVTEDDHQVLVGAGIAKPEGVAVELVDCIIRVLDTLHSLNVNIDEIVAQKMLYNASRPHKHGRAY